MKTVIKIPDGIKVKVDNYLVTVDGPKGSVSKLMKSNIATIEVKGDEVIISSRIESKRGKRMMNTFKAHINNLIKGVIDGYEARLVIRYGHFPITVKVEGDEFIINNFGGEKVPRKARIMSGCDVKVDGSEVIITGLNKELVGQTAANIELKARVKNKDLRVFQDGIWITVKPGRSGL